MKLAPRTLAVLLGLVVSTGALAQTTPASPAAPAAPATAPAAPSPAAATSASPPAAAAPAAKNDGMEGLAAVYSSKLEGRKTASGQVFRQAKLTAAHPTLPFGTRVKITNTKNDKSVEVTINDRGPTQPGRVVDLSRTAAAKIGIGANSMAPVKVEVVAEAPAKK